MLDPSAFAVSAQIFFHDRKARREETGKTRGAFRAGGLKLWHVEPIADEAAPLDADAPVPTFWAGGGSALIDRDAFTSLGGFDTLYDPFYMEDAGLSYGAWKRGFQRVVCSGRAGVACAPWHQPQGVRRQRDRRHHSAQPAPLHVSASDAPAVARTARSAVSVAGIGACCVAARVSWRWGVVRTQSVPAVCASNPASPGASAWPIFRASSRSDPEVCRVANSIRAARQTSAAVESSRDPRTVRVLVASSRLPRLKADGSWILFRLLEELASRGHEVTLFGYVEPEVDESAILALHDVGVRVLTVNRDTNRWPLLATHHVPFRLRRDYSTTRMRESLERALESVDHDVLQVEYVEMDSLIAPLLAKYADTPAVHTVHESLAVFAARTATGPGRDAVGRRGGFGNWFRLAQAARFEARSLRRYDKVVALSDTDAEVLKRLDGGRTDVVAIPSGVLVAED